MEWLKRNLSWLSILFAAFVFTFAYFAEFLRGWFFLIIFLLASIVALIYLKNIPNTAPRVLATVISLLMLAYSLFGLLMLSTMS